MSGLSIIGGSVVDGMGSPPRRADVRVERGRITEIGTGLEPVPGRWTRGACS